MKSLPWILVCLLVGVLVWMRCNPHEPSTVYIKGDTVHIRDTVRDTILKPVRETLKRTDTVYLPILIDTTTDRTVEGDSIPVLIPITSKEYKTDDYRAVVSGYKPTLDFMEVYRDNKIITLTPVQKRKRLGLGLQAGYSYPGGLYFGAGVSYNLFMW
ncbi:DUF6808 domain-containing protein [Bacteroides caccae]|uniref:DUF6808 domain-containing protein n=1 Tax=Bacteroides caccae TaxID=47678 RepID=UPI001F4024BC|nr:hypothetical protein [Bacteroides caccae]MCE8774359.1 hypothetical protein [Bacteroides caccae]